MNSDTETFISALAVTFRRLTERSFAKIYDEEFGGPESGHLHFVMSLNRLYGVTSDFYNGLWLSELYEGDYFG